MSQTQFTKRVNEWLTMDRTTRDAQNVAIEFYDTQVFPLVRECFLNKPENRPSRNYYGLILPVGWSPEPLILSILAVNPQRVALLHTPETRKHLARIQTDTGLSLDQIEPREIDGSNVIEIYQVIMEVYERWGRRSDIAVDITGGKKSMVSGAAMAGAVLGADIYYIDNKTFLRELSKPEPGSEFLSLLDNPYVVFGDLEVRKAVDVYNAHDYAGARQIFGHLQQHVTEPSHAQAYEVLKLLCETYETWDNLKIDDAENRLKRLTDLLVKFSQLDQLRALATHLPQLNEQRQALEALKTICSKRTGDERLALDSVVGFHIAFTLYFNALRRESQGKLDIACLIFYRLLEWIGQYRLAQRSIFTDEPDYSKFDEENLTNRYNELREGVFGKTPIRPLPDRISLVDGFLILAALDDPIVESLDWPAFMGQIDMRNKSMLAHGFKMIPEKGFNAFKVTVMDRFERAQALADIDGDMFTRQHQFIAPFPIHQT